MSTQRVSDRIEEIIGETARATGYSIYDTAIYLKGENSRIIVKIDREGAVSIEDCEVFSRELARELDEGKVLPNYSLEVSSPGMDRKLRSIEDFKRFAGEPAKVVYQAEETRISVKGIIAGVGEDTVELSAEGGPVVIQYAAIVRANLDYF